MTARPRQRGTTASAGSRWDGNDTIYDGAVVSIFTHNGAFTSAFPGTIDGFDLRGGDQQGFPGNINEIGGCPTGLPGGLITQGGAVFANAYARYLQITNNVVQNNGGAYGTIRIGTADISPALNHNENVRIANNRIIANGGTNLAGGDRAVRRFRQLRRRRQRHLRQLLGRVRRRHLGLRPQPERHDRAQPHLVQPVLRRGRRHHDRRCTPEQPVDRCRRAAVRSPSTATSSSRTWPTTTAAASAS